MLTELIWALASINYMPYRFLFGLIVIALVTFGYMQDYPHEQVNCLLAVSFLVFELWETLKLNKIRNTSKTFELHSKRWIWGLGLTALLIYHFSDEPMNTWNVFAIALISLTGLVNAYRNRSQFYSFNEAGIKNLFNDKLLSASRITNIQFDEIQLSVDTSDYQNELVIKSSQLKSPDWNNLTSELNKLNKTGG